MSDPSSDGDSGGRPSSPETGSGALLRGGLGFGCAGLFRLPSARARRRVLEAAWDAGIVHFDVAPMYGLGMAEAEFARFARGRRDRLVIATKFGIDITPVGRALGRVQRPIRSVLNMHPGLRARARAQAPGPTSSSGSLLYAQSGYDAAAARASLARSLLALRADHVDLFLLHDPAPGCVSPDLVEYLETAKADGMIGAWGVAGEPADAVEVARRLASPPDVIQTRTDIIMRVDKSQAVHSDTVQITFGFLGEAVGRIAGYLQSHPETRARWYEVIGHDCGKPEILARLLIRDAYRNNPHGVSLFTTVHVRRVQQATAAAESSSLDAAAEALEHFVQEELPRSAEQ